MAEINQRDWMYDIETYFDLFSCAITHIATGTRFIFEVSDRINQSAEFIRHIYWLRDIGARLVGFNNIAFDYVVMHHLITIGNMHLQMWGEYSFTHTDAYNKAQDIFASQSGPDRWAHQIWPSDRIVEQVDLFKIHHFDNRARATSLKKLEINMRSSNVIDLPYSPHEPTTSDQKDEIISYMCHDVNESIMFYLFSLDQVNFRDSLKEKYPDLGDVINFNDTKIGKKFFEMELEASGTPCYSWDSGRKKPLQTEREKIHFKDILSPKAVFKIDEFKRVRQWLENEWIYGWNTKNAFGDLSATVDGFQYDFGTGGIHGSLHKTAVYENEEWELWDWDVASYYPNLAITHGLFPAHLSSKFVEVYKELYETRQQYPKGTAENAMYKLALNGVYGDSNNVHSPFYDPQYTMAITINGQLLLCVLAEWLTHEMSTVSMSDRIRLVQINTDGLTVLVRKDTVEHMHQTCAEWENHTGLVLEKVQYKAMFIRDVNNYLAVKKSGGIKRIGAYAYETPHDNPYTRERQWNQDHSMLVIRKAAEAFMVHGTPIEEFIMNHRDIHDFQLSVKVPRSSRLEWGDEVVQNTTRYYVSTSGKGLTKVMPPLKNSAQERRIGVQKGWTVTITNDISSFKWGDVNWLFYIEEAKKLIVT